MRESFSTRLKNALIRDGRITDEQYEEAKQTAETQKKHVEDVLIESFISDEDMLSYRAEQLKITAMNLSGMSIHPEVLELVSREVAEKCKIIPISSTEITMTVAMANPHDLRTIEQLERLDTVEPRKVSPVLSTIKQIEEAIERSYSNLAKEEAIDVFLKEMGSEAQLEIVAEIDDDDDIGDLETASEAPVVKLVDAILRGAIDQSASDVHIEPYETYTRIRYRIDGVLEEIQSLPRKKWHKAVTSRIKVMSELDIAKRRIPQDGRLKIMNAGKQDIDIRVSTLPTVYGEKIVMRVSNRAKVSLSLDKLGMPEEILENYLQMVELPYGMIMVTGPTGSGKTSTLYASLNQINKPEVNIVTVEDPVEYVFEGLNQVPINHKAGMDFSAALRSILRQDPDIVMVGEMRDKETAEIGMQAALTGHLVFTTLHTNDAPSALTRLTDMEVEPFLISAAVSCVLAQRLMRRLCSNCKVAYVPTAEALKSLGLPEEGENTFYEKRGCTFCRETGYQGRTGIYEVMFMDDALRQLVLDKSDSFKIKDAAVEAGMLTLQRSATQRVIDGTTSLEEALRVVGDS